MSLVASYFKPEQNNPFGFLTRESYTSIGSTLYSTAGEVKAEERDQSSKYDAWFSNATCYMTFDRRGLTVYKDTDILYTVPGIKTLKISREGDKYFLYLNGINVSNQLKDPVQNHADNYYYFNKDGLTLTSYGDLIMSDAGVYGEDTSWYKLFQTKNFSLARYYLAMIKKRIHVSEFNRDTDIVPGGSDKFTWDTSSGYFTSSTESRTFEAQSGNHIWAVLDITSDGHFIAATSDTVDDWTAIQWSYNELFYVTEKITSFSVKADGLYVNSTRVNKKALENAATMYFCLDGDLILCDNAGNMLWSLYVEAADKWMGSTTFIADYDINNYYTTYVISAVNEYSLYLSELAKAEANYKFVDSMGGKLKTTLYSTNSLSAIHTTGKDTYLQTLHNSFNGSLTSGSVDSVYEKLKTNTELKKISTFGSVTNPVKFLQGNPSAEQATSEGNKLKTAIENLKVKRDAIYTITTSLVKSYSIPFPLIAIKGGTTNKNPATLLIKEAHLYSGGSITDYTDITGFIGAWASTVIKTSDDLKNTVFISTQEWKDFIQAIHWRPSSTNTLKVSYELSGQQATISTTSGSITFGTGIKVNCKVDWSKCVNSSQKYEIVAYPFGGGEACPNDLPTSNTRPCVDDPVNCVGGWGSFSTCENGKQTKKYLITTPAAYGGTPCLANGAPDYMTQDCTVPTTSNVPTDDKEDDKEDEEDDKSFWEKYKWYVIGGSSGLCIIIIIIILFLVLKKSPKAAT